MNDLKRAFAAHHIVPLSPPHYIPVPITRRHTHFPPLRIRQCSKEPESSEVATLKFCRHETQKVASLATDHQTWQPGPGVCAFSHGVTIKVAHRSKLDLKLKLVRLITWT